MKAMREVARSWPPPSRGADIVVVVAGRGIEHSLSDDTKLPDDADANADAADIEPEAARDSIWRLAHKTAI